MFYPALMKLLRENEGVSESELEERFSIEKRHQLSPKHILIEDPIASVSYILNLNHNIGTVDDIDHLGNRRLRTVGELLQNQFRIGLARMERVRQGENDDSGCGSGNSAGSDEYPASHGGYQRIFRQLAALSVHGPEQSAE